MFTYATKRPSGDQSAGAWKSAAGIDSSASFAPRPRTWTWGGLSSACCRNARVVESGDQTGASRMAGSAVNRRPRVRFDIEDPEILLASFDIVNRRRQPLPIRRQAC